MAWRFKTEEDLTMHSDNFKGIYFKSEWVTFDGVTLCVKEGYAWDGCSPAWKLPFGIWLGTWDGPLGPDEKPVSWVASLVHDILCQYQDQLTTVTKEQSVKIFKEMLVRRYAPKWMSTIYPLAVDYFGPQQWPGDTQ